MFGGKTGRKRAKGHSKCLLKEGWAGEWFMRAARRKLRNRKIRYLVSFSKPVSARNSGQRKEARWLIYLWAVHPLSRSPVLR
jgi:hypothetical protein